MRRAASLRKLENCLVSTFDGDDSDRAVEALRRKGLGVLKLSGHDGFEPMSALHQMADDSGGEFRILDEIYQELSKGNLSLIIEVVPERSDEITEVLYGSGARSVWKYEDWAFVKTGSRRPDRST